MNPQQWLRQMQQAQAGASKLLPQTTQTLSKRVLRFFLDNFDHGGSEPQKSFVPWKERKYRYNHKILQKTGRLRQAFRIETSGPKGFTIVNTAPYADYMNAGTATTPARPILYSSKEIEALVSQQLQKSLLSLFSS